MPMDNGKTLLTLFAGFPKVPEELQDVAFQIFDDHGVVGVGTTDQRGQCWLEGISEKQNYFLELHIPELKT
jgi:hypothetical protein